MNTRRGWELIDYGSLTLLNGIQCLGPHSGWLVSSTVRNLTANRLEDEFHIIGVPGGEELRIAGNSPLLSPDGSKIAYEYEGALMIYDLPSRQSRKLATIYSSDYFLGHMANKNFEWSPDSNSIAYISTEPHEQSEPPTQQVSSRLLYKTKGGRGREKFADNYLSHIWLVSLDGSSPSCLTPGAYNEHSITWSPDGKFIAFISNRNNDPDRTHHNDLFKVEIQSLEITTLVSGKGTRFAPAWSPRGDRIAYLADESTFTSKDSPAPDTHVFTVDSSGTIITRVAADLDRRIENVKWGKNGESLYFLAGDHGSTVLFSCEPDSARFNRVVQGEFLIKDYCINDDLSIAFVKNSTNQPDEAFLYKSSDKTSIQISRFNSQLTDNITFAEAETFWCKSADGTAIQGWIIKPFDFDESSSYPLVLVMHGGPHNMYGYEFDEKMQSLAAAGFGVVYFNPRGSTGYGQDFTYGNLLNWGGKDYEDIMSGIEYVIANYQWVDANRMGVTGQSYGGFLTNWIITQTDRFKAAVSDGGISNLVSFAGTSLYHCLIEAEFNGETWNNYPLLWQWSPLHYVKAVVTPTLFLHGETDNEVPVGQSEEMFSALKRLGVETMLVSYKDEGHGWRPDLLPENRIDVYERMIAWFKKYL